MKKVEANIMGNIYDILFLENADEKEKYPHICGNMGATLTSSKMILIDTISWQKRRVKNESNN